MSFGKRRARRPLFTRQLAPRPSLHAQGREDWGLEPAVIEFVSELVTAASVTAETGAGMSTILLAEKGCQHFSVTPSAEEIARVRAVCADRGFDMRRVRFCEGLSQDLLPGLDLPALDLVIIDGGHGMPVPFVDWCYLAPRLKVGGTLIVDDVDIWTSAVLCDFLRAEWQWELIRSFRKAMAFRKMRDPVITDWGGQPFVMARSMIPRDWKWGSNALHGHVSGIEAVLDEVERQGTANADEIGHLVWAEGELLDCIRRIEAICAMKSRVT